MNHAMKERTKGLVALQSQWERLITPFFSPFFSPALPFARFGGKKNPAKRHVMKPLFGRLLFALFFALLFALFTLSSPIPTDMYVYAAVIPDKPRHSLTITLTRSSRLSTMLLLW